MRKLLLLLVIFASFRIVFAQNEQVDITLQPLVIPSHQNVSLNIAISNLNNTNNITKFDIEFLNNFIGYSVTGCNYQSSIPYFNFLNCSNYISAGENYILTVNGSSNIEVSQQNVYIIFRFYYDDNSVYEIVKNIEARDLSPPVLEFLFPNSFVYSPFGYNLTLTVSDNLNVSSVEIFLNDSKIGELSTLLKRGNVTIKISDLPAGNHTINISLTDVSGNKMTYNRSLEIKLAPNPIDVYLNEFRNRNITVEVNSIVRINASSIGNVCIEILGFPASKNCSLNFSSILILLTDVGNYSVFVNSSGNQNYTQNSSGVVYQIRVIYPRIVYSLIKAPTSEIYEPQKNYEFRINFTSGAYPYNNITNVSFQLNNRTYYLTINDKRGGIFSYTVKDLSSGQYSWEFCAVDSQNEKVCARGTLTVSKATPELDILNSGEYVVPINKTIIAVGCPEQLVCNFYLNGTKLTNNFYDLITNRPGYYVFIYNTTGNENYTSYQVVKTVKLIEPRNITETPKNQTIQKTENYTENRTNYSNIETKLRSFSSVFQNIINIENEDIVKIRQIVVEVNTNQNNIYFEVTPPTKIPEKMPPGLVFVFVEIKTNISEDSLKSVKFRFKVDKIWINSNKIDVSTISLYRWDGSDWKKLNTFKMSEDENFVYFEAQGNRLSILAICGEKVKEAFPWWLVLILVVVVIVIAFVLYLFWPTKVGTSEYEKLKEKWKDKLSGLRTH